MLAVFLPQLVVEDRSVPMQGEQGCPVILSSPGEELWSADMLHRCGEGFHLHCGSTVFAVQQ